MEKNLAAISALRTIERAVVVPRDADERRAVLGAFKALYRLHSPRTAEYPDGGTEPNA